MILNFGPLDVYIDGVALSRKTFGGVTLNFKTIAKNEIKNDFDQDEVIIGGTGSLNFHSWPTTTLSSSLEIYDYGEVILLNNNITITLYKCKMLFDTSISAGTNKQGAIKIRLVFTANDAGNVIKIQ